MIYAIRMTDVVGKSRAAYEHKAGRFLLKYGFMKEYGLDLSCCTIIKNEHGKPYIKEYPDIYFNISHCKTMAVCVLGKEPVGVDVESRRTCKASLMKRVLTKEELEAVKASEDEILEFFKYWTLKEAYGKATGVGMLYDYASTAFKFIERSIICPDKEYSMWQKVIDNELVISVCRKQNEEFEEALEVIEPDYNELEETE